LGIIFLVNVPRRRYLDFSNSTTEKIETAHGFQGVYSAYIFAAEAQRAATLGEELAARREAERQQPLGWIAKHAFPANTYLFR
jgi:hypothetical protein